MECCGTLIIIYAVTNIFFLQIITQAGRSIKFDLVTFTSLHYDNIVCDSWNVINYFNID